MPKFYAAQTNFIGGSINEDLLGRTELGFYANSVRRMVNAHTIPQGGLVRAPGTERLGLANTGAARLLPWIISTTEAYVVEISGTTTITKIRAIIGTTVAASFTVSFTGSPASVRPVQRGDALILFLPGKVIRLYRSPTGTIALQDTGFFVAPNDEVGDQYDARALSDPTFTITGTTLTSSAAYFREADVGRQFSMGEGLATVTAFTSTTSVTVSIIAAFTPTSALWSSTARPGLLDSPNAKIALTAAKTVVGDTQTLTADKNTWKWVAGGFVVEDIGRYVKINGGLIEITAVTSATIATGVIRRALDNTADAFAGGWRIHTALLQAATGKPYAGETINAATIYEGRLILGGFTRYPSRIYASRTGAIQDFSTGVVADDGFQFDIDSSRADPVINLATQNDLLVFTLSGEYAIKGSDSGPLKPLSIKVELKTSHGSSQVQTVAVGTDEFFAQRGGLKIRAYGYSGDSGESVSPDVTIRRSDLFESTTVKRLVYAQAPHQLLYTLGNDGKIRLMCIDKSSGVYAWSNLSMTGVVDMAVIPDATGDATYIIIQRGSELLLERFRYDYPMASTFQGTPTAGVLAVPHPNGQVLDVIRYDTFYSVWVYEGQKTVASNQITGLSAGLHQVGINAQCSITLLPVEAEVEGSLQGRRASYNRIMVRCYRTNPALRVAGETMQFTQLKSPDATPNPYGLFTGDAHATLRGWADNQPEITIQMDAPLDFRLVSVVRTITVND